jgi:signal transduction histidine kinase
MAVVSAVLSHYVDIAAGYQYTDFLTPIWNAGNRLAVFLLVVILFSHRDQLRKLVAERTESLRQEIQERCRLEKELLEIAEAEQRRIGHDLHDSLGQHLTATALAGKLLAKKLASQTPVEPAVAARVVAMVEEAIDLTRSLARSLHPMELRADGLAVALQSLADELSKAFHISCRFECSGTIRLADSGAGLQLYRIAQEAASNAIRHGQARNLVISLAATSGRLLLAVTDDGTGVIAHAGDQKGMGLRIMNYRASLIGAAFDLQNLPAGGARAVCVLDQTGENSKA